MSHSSKLIDSHPIVPPVFWFVEFLQQENSVQLWINYGISQKLHNCTTAIAFL